MQLNCRPVGLCVLVILMLGLFLWLGTWQLNRAEEKTLILEQSIARSQQGVTTLDLTKRDYSSIRYAPIKITGEYDVAHQFLFDNQIKNQKVGYHVFTPVKIAGSSEAVLVDRGWVPQGLTRQLLPEVDFVQTNVEIIGDAYTPFAGGIRLGDLDNGEFTWPRVIQFIDFEAISERLGYHLLPVILRLSVDAENGYLREWHTVNFGPKKHIGYAFQWYALAVAMFVILVILGLKKESNEQ